MFNDASSSEMFATERYRSACRDGIAAIDLKRLDRAALILPNPDTSSRTLSATASRDRLSRGVDVSIALFLLLSMLPALLVIALAIWCGDGGSPFFVHKRVGRGGRHFPCFKFRTMVRDSDERLRIHLAVHPRDAWEWEHYRKLRNDPRITRLGRFLRKTSLDEIPQLANVVLGHMSLVGPRPIVEEEIARYRHYFARYCSLRPGITGLWQVSGRNDVSYRRRVALDIVYCRSKSLSLDLFILAKTVPAVVSGRGCS